MNFSLNSVFSKYTANSDFPTPLKLCRFSTTSAIHLFKNSTWLCRRTGKKQVPSCSCLRSPNRIRITRYRTLFWAKKQGPQAIPCASQHTRNTRKIASAEWRNFKAKVTDAPKLWVILQQVKRLTLSLFWTVFIYFFLHLAATPSREHRTMGNWRKEGNWNIQNKENVGRTRNLYARIW